MTNETPGATPQENAPPPQPSTTATNKKVTVIGWIALSVAIGAFFLGLIPFLGLLLAIAAIALGIVAIVKKNPAWIGIVVLIAGGLALIAGLISTIGFTALVGSSASGSRPVPSISTTAEADAPAEPEETEVAEEPEIEEPAAPVTPDLATFGTVDERTLALIAKEPDNHVGQNLIVYGSITQLDSATGPCGALISIAEAQKENSFDYGQNSYATAGDGETECPVFDPLVEGDHVKLWVTVLGSLSYDTQIGGNTTVPAIEVWQAELLPAQEF